MDTVIYRYDNAGKALGELVYDSATHDEDLDGRDKLSVRCRQNVAKMQRLVWRDNAGVWHEHVIDSWTRTRNGGRPRTDVECSNSISELFGLQASGTVLKGSVQDILESLLRNTRWTAGKCSNFGRKRVEVYHKSIRECINDLVSACGGELETAIAVNDSGVSSRKVRIVKKRGSSQVRRQFAYGVNMTGVTREVLNDIVFTKVIGYGVKTEEASLQEQYDELRAQDTSKMDDDEKKAREREIESLRKALNRVKADDYAGRLTVTSTSSDLDLEQWGVPTGNGFGHSVTTYTDAGCTDQAFLQRQCDELLESYRPNTFYKFDVMQVDDDTWRDVSLGNYVLVLDEGFNPPLEFKRRVTSVKRNLSGRMSCVVSIGKRRNYTAEQFKAVEKVTREKSGNSVKGYSMTPSITGAKFDSSAYSPVTAGGTPSPYGSQDAADSIVHTLDGQRITSGVINFTTVAESEQSTGGGSLFIENASKIEQAGMGLVENLSSSIADLWGGLGGSSDDSSSAWGGGGDGDFSSSGGGGF